MCGAARPKADTKRYKEQQLEQRNKQREPHSAQGGAGAQFDILHLVGGCGGDIPQPIAR
eukprot:gene4026-6404_t